MFSVLNSSNILSHLIEIPENDSGTKKSNNKRRSDRVSNYLDYLNNLK